MNRSFSHAQNRRIRAKRYAPALAVLVAVTGLSAAGLSAAGGAAADSAAPAISLVTPVSTQTVERYKGEHIYLYDLGLYVLAKQATVDLRVKRTSYLIPPVATLRVGEGAGATEAILPSSLFSKDMNVMSNFFTIVITNSAGKQVKTTKLDFCPNSDSAARSVRDAPATSPYPYQCGESPFVLGSVFGIQRGWSVSALNEFYSAPEFAGPDGTYTLNVKINQPWRAGLGLTDSQGKSNMKLKVKTVSYSDAAVRQLAAAKTAKTAGASGMGAMSDMPGMEQMAGMEHMSSAPTGPLGPQRATMEAARIKALGKPNIPHQAAPTHQLRAADVPAGTPMPDLRSLPAYQIMLDKHDANGKLTKKTYLNFGATVWNGGTSPMVVDGFRRTGTGLMDAYQYFFDGNGTEVGSTPAGTLQWDGRKGHNHWHFTAFATYRLLDSTQKVALRSGKEAFCLAPTDPVDLTLTGANWRPASTDLTTACGQGNEGALSIREVLDGGWGDTYSQSLPGQSFDITKVPNGIYYIEVLANPDNKLTESNSANNRSLRKVRIGGTVGGKRTIKVYYYQGITVP